MPIKDEITLMRQKLTMDIEYLMISAKRFNDACIKTLGEASREEIIDAMIKFYVEEMEKLK